MSLREKFQDFKQELITTYNSVVPNESIKFYLDIVDGNGEPFPSEITDIEAVVDELNTIDAMTELPVIYYNDKNGRERECSVLKVSKLGGIVAFDYNDAEIVYFGFSEINLINDQITLIELLIKKARITDIIANQVELKKKFKVKDIESGEVTEWSLDSILEEINRDHSGDWTDYDVNDWREGWYEWVDGEFYSLIEDIEVGDVVEVRPNRNFTLHCATSVYHQAVVISLEPFVLTSKTSDMRWQSTVKKNDFRKSDTTIKDETLQICMRRL